MTSVNTQQNFTFRVYDGTAVTPFYVEATFLDPPTLPLIAPRPETNVVLGGNKATAGNITTVVPDESVIFTPIPFSIRFALQSEAVELLDAFGNPRGKASWTVGGDNWIPVTVANIGTRVNSLGAAVATPGPADSVQINGLYNIEILNAVPANAPAGVVFAASLKGCVTTTVAQVTEEIQVFITLDGLIFGEIDSEITAFTTGTQSTLP